MASVDLLFQFRGRQYTEAGRGLDAVGKALQDGYVQSAAVLSAQLRTALTALARELAARNSAAWPSGTTPHSLSARSGAMVAQIEAGVRVSGSTLATLQGGLVGDPAMFAHEYGVTVTAKGAKYLAIPLPAALKPNGEPLKAAPRDWQDTFVAMSKAGHLLIFQRQANRTLLPLYLLKNSVRLPPRLGAGDLFRTGLSHFERQAMETIVNKMLGK